MKRHIQLVDPTGFVWVEADLSDTRIKSLIRAYSKLGYELTERIA